MNLTEHSFEETLNSKAILLERLGITTRDIIELLLAIKFNKIHERIPLKTHQKLMSYFCHSSGELQELIHFFRTEAAQDLCDNLPLESKNFKVLPRDFTSIIHQLKDDGYAKLPFQLSPEKLDEIYSLVSESKHSCLIKNKNSFSRVTAESMNLIPKHTITASVQEEVLTSSPVIQSVVCDPLLLGIASFYMKSKALVSSMSLWHNYESPNKEPQSEAAQLFHYDLDEFRWLKLFIFLSDVTIENGPHVYIPGTHLPNTKHPELLLRGYVRIPDSDMQRFHPKDNWKTITCPKGTLIFADTRCWHKGTAVLQGMRSVLVPVYAPTTFSQQFI